MNRPKLLDLFCCAGGAAMGYSRAGFDVYGVDIEDRVRYPFAFHLGDAIDVMAILNAGGTVVFVHKDGTTETLSLADFAAVHGSPPCQQFTAYGRSDTKGWKDNYLDLVEPTREALIASGLPYIIENVVGAPLIGPVMLCGSSFGLDVRRHRLFESNVVMLTPPCDHSWQTPRFAPSSTRTNLRSTVEVGVWRIPLDVQRKAMGIDWMELRELSEAIPPAYTEYIGARLIEALAVAA